MTLVFNGMLRCITTLHCYALFSVLFAIFCSRILSEDSGVRRLSTAIVRGFYGEAQGGEECGYEEEAAAGEPFMPRTTDSSVSSNTTTPFFSYCCVPESDVICTFL